MALSLRASIDVRAAAADIFELVCTPERLPEWNVSVVQARRCEPGQPVGLGSRAIFSGRLLGQTLESETEVIEFESPRLFATRAIRGPRLMSRFALEPLPHGTRVLVEVSGVVPGGRVGEALAVGFLRKELLASLGRLRDLSEALATERG